MATLDLMKKVCFDQAFMFAYSEREGTRAARRFSDNVPPDVKLRRLEEIISTFRYHAHLRSNEMDLNRVHIVLVEGSSLRSTEQSPTLTGRTDTNKRVIFTEKPVLDWCGGGGDLGTKVLLQNGDYLAVRITEAKGHTLRGEPLARVTLAGIAALGKQNQAFGIKMSEFAAAMF